MSAPTPPSPVELARGQIAPIETKLRASIDLWRRNLETAGVFLQERLKAPGDQDAGLKSSHAIIYRIIAEMDSATQDLRVVAEDLAAARADAEFRAVLVSGWPANHFLDRLSYLGTALFGAGGAAFVYGAGFQDPIYRFGPTVSLWGLGLSLLAYSLWGLSRWEESRWRYFAKEFAVPEEYHPPMFRPKRLGIWRRLFNRRG